MFGLWSARRKVASRIMPLYVRIDGGAGDGGSGSAGGLRPPEACGGRGRGGLDGLVHRRRGSGARAAPRAPRRRPPPPRTARHNLCGPRSSPEPILAGHRRIADGCGPWDRRPAIGMTEPGRSSQVVALERERVRRRVADAPSAPGRRNSPHPIASPAQARQLRPLAFRCTATAPGR